MRKYPQSKIIRLDSYSVAAAWTSLALAAVLYVLFLAGLPLVPLLFAAGALYVLSLVAHLALAFAHKCAECSKHPTIQGFAQVHPHASSSGIDSWAGVVKGVIKRGQFVCIHCGAAYSVSPAA